MPLGTKTGSFKSDSFNYRRCTACQFSFVNNPWLDYPAIYSDDYYRGNGADPFVDYLFELEHPDETIRHYEWRGILQVVRSLVGIGPETRWLDYGCGNGGLVRYCREQAQCNIVGYEEGWIRDRAEASGIPFVTSAALEGLDQTFDVITAIEVIEHIPDPLDFLRRLRRLLKPGGLLFLTTGNAQPHRADLLRWQYTVPEIHVSYFEPETLSQSLTAAGFRPEYRGYLPGFTDIIRFKTLKNLHYTRRTALEKVLPWSLLARLINMKYQVTAHPVGWAV